MSIKEIFLDSSRYAASDWTKFIFLGILFLLTDFLDRLTPENFFLEFMCLVVIFWLILFLLQAGYIFTIIESSLKGQDKLPPWGNFKELFLQDLKIVPYF